MRKNEVSGKPQDRTSAFETEPVNIQSYEAFCQHPIVDELKTNLRQKRMESTHAIRRLISDLEVIGSEYHHRTGNRLFSSSPVGRTKSIESFLRKLFERVRVSSESGMAITRSLIIENFHAIRDVAGVRIACSFFDDVLSSVEAIKASLASLGYGAVNRDADGVEIVGGDYLDDGEPDTGYRSFHFFIGVPTPIDIYSNTKVVLCEVQARTELQDIWAQKSHELLYKGRPAEDLDDGQRRELIEDMKQISNSLRTADHYLNKIRNSVLKRKSEE